MGCVLRSALANPVKISAFLKDLLALIDIEAKEENVKCRVTLRSGAIVEEIAVESLSEFVKLYPLVEAINIEVKEPRITVRESFKVNLLLITLRRINKEWVPYVYVEEQEIPRRFYDRWLELVKRRARDVMEKVLELVRFIIMLYDVLSKLRS